MVKAPQCDALAGGVNGSTILTPAFSKSERLCKKPKPVWTQMGTRNDAAGRAIDCFAQFSVLASVSDLRIVIT